jgi:eukaryotic-like serine/threonine-protein kinase
MPAVRFRLGNYEPLLELAAGGMATVYVARQVGAGGFERLVVVKRVHPHLLSNRDFYDMFKDEGRVAAMLHHPNVVPVTDVVESEGELFLVMEYVESTSLATVLTAANKQGQRLPPAVVSRILIDMLSGLHAAHEAVDMRGNGLEIVHRDVSPQNVIVGIDGSSRLIDFGVAKARHRLTETRSGSLKGKYGYMAPEQARATSLDRRADLFSAGIVLWEALTGERLFRSDNEGAVVAKVLDSTVDPPSRATTPALDEATRRAIAPLDEIVMRGLARDPASRFETAREMALALEKALPPATSSQVSEWVETIANDVLVMRAAQVAEIESSSAELARTSATAPPELDTDLPLLPKPGEPRSGGSTAVQVAIDGQSAGALSSLSVASNSPPPKSLTPGRRRGGWLALGLGVLVLGPLVGFGITRGGILRSDTTVGAPPSSEGTGSSPSVSASAPVVDPPAPPATAAVANPPDATAPSSSAPAPTHTPLRVATPRTTPATNKTTPSHASVCDPPFTYDATGKKHYKPECL